MPKYCWKHIQRRLRWFVDLKYFNNFFLFLILVNTILLAIEYDGMPAGLSEFLNMTNLVLTQLFTLEVLLKVRPAPGSHRLAAARRMALVICPYTPPCLICPHCGLQ